MNISTGFNTGNYFLNRVDIVLTASLIFIIAPEIWLLSGSWVWRAGMQISLYLLQ
jgi:hypothetical protein